MTTYQSTAFLCAIIASWLICQIIKFILSLKQKPKDKSFASYFLFVATKMGGVVSSHSVLVSSLISSLIVAIIRIGYDPGSLIITLIIGEGSDMELASELADEFEDKYDVEVEIVDGGQPVYSYMVGVE